MCFPKSSLDAKYANGEPNEHSQILQDSAELSLKFKIQQNIVWFEQYSQASQGSTFLEKC